MPEKGSAGKRTNADARARERAAISRAMLELAGERGYRAVRVEDIAARVGVGVDRFYSHFAGRRECFFHAYQQQAEPLLAAMLAAGHRAAGWREGVRAALTELFRRVVAQPVTSCAILAEVYVAGGEALARHEEALERLSRAIDGACRETTESRHSPPPVTATFMVGAIEESVRAHLAAGSAESLWQDLPELMSIVTGAYLGDEVAAQERCPPAATEET
jgi:AcrR family transcriptional regulator